VIADGPSWGEPWSSGLLNWARHGESSSEIVGSIYELSVQDALREDDQLLPLTSSTKLAWKAWRHG
jgi:hypothetical protein